MGANSFGRFFKFTTWGESHGKALGVVIDGCPAGLSLRLEDIQKALDDRKPGKNPLFSSQRKESDRVQILSGVYQGMTTGHPISLLVENVDQKSDDYEDSAHLYRPGHASFTYHHKYGHYDHRGGGRSSGRETLCRVAAGAVASSFLNEFGIDTCASLYSLGKEGLAPYSPSEMEKSSWQMIRKDSLFCLDPKRKKLFLKELESLQEKGESTGGAIAVWARGVPSGLGDPVYAKLNASLASAWSSIPAAKKICFGDEASLSNSGSFYRDEMKNQGDDLFKSNRSGGILGGISTGQLLYGNVSFKPTSSTATKAHTLDKSGCNAIFLAPSIKRHDPCLAIRAVPVVKAMTDLVLADALLSNALSNLSYLKKIYISKK